MKTKTQTLILFLCLCSLYARSQEAVVSSGGDILAPAGEVSYSVGLPFFEAFATDQGSISQGVQQSYTIVTVGSHEKKISHVHLSLFPNPVADHLNLHFEGASLPLDLKYNLYDLQGRLIRSDRITDYHMRIPVVELQSATYLFTVSDKTEIYQSFQIIKH